MEKLYESRRFSIMATEAQIKVKHIVITCFLCLLGITSSFAQDERTYVTYSNPRMTIRYMREGLLCSGLYKNKYHIRFIHRDNLSVKKIVELDNFIRRHSVWQMREQYRKRVLVLDASWNKFTLHRHNEEKYKTIFYANCYNQILDSFMVYINDLIPKSKRKHYDINGFRTLPCNDSCGSNGIVR